MENKYNLVLVILVVAVGFVMLSNMRSPQITGGVVMGFCGDNICDEGEDNINCYKDCGETDPCADLDMDGLPDDKCKCNPLTCN